MATHGLQKVYASGQNANKVIDNLTLKLYEKEFTVIMGSSGSGKSTLLYLLAGLDQLTQGNILFKDQAIHQMNENELAIWRRENVGFVFQSANLIPNLTLLENIMVAGHLVERNSELVRKRAEKLLSLAGLEELYDRLPSQLSGGQQQRSAMVRALVNSPRILLADEPTGSLNSASSQSVLEIFQAFHQEGQTILMVTHDIKSACYGQRVLYFRDGLIEDELLFGKELSSMAEREKILTHWLLTKGW